MIREDGNKLTGESVFFLFPAGDITGGWYHLKKKCTEHNAELKLRLSENVRFW